ncbi:MAG: prepilin-type N-terminal cleavage/methylation domain-containing protein [Candidatus Rokubacteria bacterium]|nr:prepilin-type N-terminal cleavage/methylation domain-containing protein [Candidatus Rokubacteria bacterium]
MRGERGVTLVELMVVVAIIAVLAAIAITMYQNVVAKSRFAADQGLLGAMRSAIALYYGQHNGNFPGSPGKYVQPSPPLFQCTALSYTYDGTTGTLSVTSSNTVADCP